jgi:hypothetical protein
MAEIILQKRGNVFTYVPDESIEIVQNIKQGAIFFDSDAGKRAINNGDIYRAKFSRMRKGDNHKRYFAMLQAVFRNQDKYEHWDFKSFLREIKLGLGHTNDFVNEDGKMVFELLSISFSKMDETEFRSFFSRTIDLILARFINGTPEDIERMTLEILSYA